MVERYFKNTTLNFLALISEIRNSVTHRLIPRAAVVLCLRLCCLAFCSSPLRPYLRESPERHLDHRIYFSCTWNWSGIVIYSHIKICSLDVGTERIRTEIKQKAVTHTSTKYNLLRSREGYTRSYRSTCTI